MIALELVVALLVAALALLWYHLRLMRQQLMASHEALVDAVQLVIEVDENHASNGSPRVLTPWGVHRQQWLESVRHLRGWVVVR